jgi:hypothetical protein
MVYLEHQPTIKEHRHLEDQATYLFVLFYLLLFEIVKKTYFDLSNKHFCPIRKKKSRNI